jgi:alpha-glucosidase
MVADEARTARVKLDFLPPGRHRATVWEDGEAARELKRSVRIVQRGDVLTLRQAAAGGAAVVLEPVSRPAP